MSWLSKVFELNPAGLNWPRAVMFLDVALVPLVVFWAIGYEQYLLSALFGMLFAGLADAGGGFGSRAPHITVFALIGAALTALGFGIGGDAWGSAISNLALATPAAAASRRASATWIRGKSAPRACPLPVARAARMVVSPQPHPMSRTFSPSWICAAASNRAVSRPRIRSCRSRCSMKCLPLAPFQSSACSAFTATKDTLYRPAILPGPVPDAPSGTFLPEIATVAGACQSGEFCAQPLV